MSRKQPKDRLQTAGATRRAFSLVELLVVVAVIALLMAITAPSLQRAKELTRRSICATQLHHQGVACNTYAAEGDKLYPPSVTVGHWPFGGMSTIAGQPDKPAGQAILHLAGLLPGKDSLYCPSAVVESGITTVRHWRPENWDSTFFGYPYWGPYWGQADGLDDLLARNTLSPSDRVLMTDLSITPDWWWQSNHKDARGEFEGGNTLRNDGSARWFEAVEMEPRFLHANQTFYF